MTFSPDHPNIILTDSASLERPLSSATDNPFASEGIEKDMNCEEARRGNKRRCEKFRRAEDKVSKEEHTYINAVLSEPSFIGA